MERLGRGRKVVLKDGRTATIDTWKGGHDYVVRLGGQKIAMPASSFARVLPAEKRPVEEPKPIPPGGTATATSSTGEQPPASDGATKAPPAADAGGHAS